MHTLVLTGSGGPFRGRTRDELANVTPDEALAHPTWSMGPKITVDSATLANKGLELIEAHFLFGIPYDRIEVVIQPTSIVHSLVRFRDGAALAHLGYPDMRVPISYALTYPERAATPLAAARPDHADARVRGARPRDVPDARARARGGGEGRHLPVRVQRRERGRRRGVPRRPAAVPRHRRGRRATRSRAPTARRRAISTSSSRQTGPRARFADERLGRSHDLARRRPVGLLLLVFLHELGHFTVALAVGIRPRSFYVGFPPALVKVKRKGIEYGIGVIPLGGLVRIPGMHRPAPHDLEAFTATAVREEPALVGARAARPPAARGGRLRARARRAARAAQRDRSARELSAGARRSANRALREIDEGTGDGRLLARADVEAHLGDRRRPGR